MYYELYIDQFAVEQFLTGYLLLTVCVRLLGKKVSGKRIAAGSLMHALFSVSMVCIGVWWMASVSMLAAGMIVFGIGNRKQFVSGMLILLLVTMCFAGSIKLLLQIIELPAAVACLLSAWIVNICGRFLMRNRTIYEQKQLISVRLYWKDRSILLQAIWDTGNQLLEPITKKPVSIAEYSAVKPLLGEYWMEEHGCYLIPYHSLGTEKSWMHGVVIDKLEIVMEKTVLSVKKPMIGLYEGTVSSTKRYQVILHPEHLM